MTFYFSFIIKCGILFDSGILFSFIPFHQQMATLVSSDHQQLDADRSAAIMGQSPALHELSACHIGPIEVPVLYRDLVTIHTIYASGGGFPSDPVEIARLMEAAQFLDLRPLTESLVQHLLRGAPRRIREARRYYGVKNDLTSREYRDLAPPKSLK